jgi:hypothetical protein
MKLQKGFVKVLVLLLYLSVGLNSAYAQLSTLVISVKDSATAQHTPARIKVTRNGHVVKQLPAGALSVMYGLWDHADAFGFQPDSSFYMNGTCSLHIDPGTYKIHVSKGFEYLDEASSVIVDSSQVETTFLMNRWINMPSKGWYSADTHIHLRRSPREDTLLNKWIQAENLNIGVLLRMGDFWETYYDQYAWGDKGVYQEGNFLLSPGQEDPRTPELGHALGIGASDKVRYSKDYYYYDKVFDKLHELNGITGYAHQAETFHGYRGLVLDGLRNKVDAMELLQFCVSDQPLQTQHYYHMLDLGIPITAIAGSDFPWCGNDHINGRPENSARIGNVRFYTNVRGNLTFNNWKQGLCAGRTFVSSGPMIEFSVNDSLPGSTVRVKKGSSIKIKAKAYGHPKQVPLSRIEIVSHGEVVKVLEASDKNRSELELSIDLKVPYGMWIAARCFAGKQQVAHTTPIYVVNDSNAFHNPKTVANYIALSEQYLDELVAEINKRNENPEYQSWRYKKGLEMRIQEVRNILSTLKTKLK